MSAHQPSTRARASSSASSLVVLVDDDRNLCDLVQRFLENAGHTVDHVELARSESELLDKLAPGAKTDVAVIDERLRLSDTGDIVARIQSSEPRTTVRGEGPEGLPTVVLTTLGARPSPLTRAFPHTVAKPVRQARLASAIARCLGRSEAAETPAARETTSPVRQANVRVLVVEDNRDSQVLAERLLAGISCDVDVAENGKTAVEAVASKLYDLIFMDLMMPVLDGFEAVRQIRASEPERQRVPIVALTAHATEGFRDECIAAGMDDYISKPFKKERLLAMVEQWGDRRPVILIVDDSRESRLILDRFLSPVLAAQLSFASNGREAIEFFERRIPSRRRPRNCGNTLNGWSGASAAENTAPIHHRLRTRSPDR